MSITSSLLGIHPPIYLSCMLFSEARKVASPGKHSAHREANGVNRIGYDALRNESPVKRIEP
jgi:hypothetical protein